MLDHSLFRCIDVFSSGQIFQEPLLMKIHEYQARDILAKFGIPVPPARVVDTPAQAMAAFTENNAPLQVVKAQVFAGGRGKAGFVRLVRSAQEAQAAAEFMLTHRMVSPQTGPEGVSVQKVLLAPAVDIDHEYYVGITLDRSKSTPTIIASAEGGVEIETVARERPSAIIKEPLHPLLGLQPYQGRKIARQLGFTGKETNIVASLLVNLARVFNEYDCSLAEINPLVRTKSGQILAIDAKVTFDDNAIFRHQDIVAIHDPAQFDPLEARASKANLSYIKLDGNIGCLVNGAGLAMATMDVIQLHGGRPANFLDVGGGVKADAAIEAFRIILSDPHVKGILVNIFGGIARCDLIAEALIAAGREIGFKLPVVVRLEGTNVARARELLQAAQHDLPTMQIATDLNDAAKKIVASSKK